MLTVNLLRVHSQDMAELTAELTGRLQRGGALLREMPLVLELTLAVDLAALLSTIRGLGMKPFALLQPDETQRALATSLGLVALETLGGNARERPAPEPAPTIGANRKPSMIVAEPIRSGQQIYARDTDLVVLNTVAAGSEVIADGNIHIYGSLRGRALAGARGDAEARIYCQQFAAELVAVAGNYVLTEDLDSDRRKALWGQAVQAWLTGNNLNLARLPQP